MLPESISEGAKYSVSENNGSASHYATIFTTFHLNIAHSVDAQPLAAKLADKHCALIRAKGFVLDNDGGIKTIQVVGRRWSVSDAPESVAIGLVCIGLSGVLSEKRISAFCQLAMEETA